MISILDRATHNGLRVEMLLCRQVFAVNTGSRKRLERRKETKRPVAFNGSDDVPWSATYTHTVAVGDTDAYGVLFNANYLKCTANARERLFRSVIQHEGVISCYKIQSIRFHTPVHLGDTISATARIQRFDANLNEYELSYELFRHSDGTVCFSCTGVYVRLLNDAFDRLVAEEGETDVTTLNFSGFEFFNAIDIPLFEGEVSGTAHRVREDDVLRWLERARSRSASQLQKLWQNNTAVVVSRVDHLKVHTTAPGWHGHTFTVSAYVKWRMNNTVMQCMQYCSTPNGHIVATANVTCLVRDLHNGTAVSLNTPCGI